MVSTVILMVTRLSLSLTVLFEKITCTNSQTLALYSHLTCTIEVHGSW